MRKFLHNQLIKRLNKQKKRLDNDIKKLSYLERAEKCLKVAEEKKLYLELLKDPAISLFYYNIKQDLKYNTEQDFIKEPKLIIKGEIK